MTDRVRALAWPLFAVSGLLIVGFSLVSWGDSDQGIDSKISGVGRVSVPGAQPEDVAFLEAHTQRPALVTIVLKRTGPHFDDVLFDAAQRAGQRTGHQPLVAAQAGVFECAAPTVELCLLAARRARAPRQRA